MQDKYWNCFWLFIFQDIFPPDDTASAFYNSFSVVNKDLHNCPSICCSDDKIFFPRKNRVGSTFLILILALSLKLIANFIILQNWDSNGDAFSGANGGEEAQWGKMECFKQTLKIALMKQPLAD